MDLAVSSPIMVMLIVDGSLCWFKRPALWHIDAVGGRPPHLDRAAGPAGSRPEERTGTPADPAAGRGCGRHGGEAGRQTPRRELDPLPAARQHSWSLAGRHHAPA